MIHGKRVLVYIPARSGSKSIKDKNIVDVAGKPLMAYTIEAAKASKYVDRVIVSTDSEQYGAIAQKFGADVPFLRPSEFATDTSPEMDTTIHLMDWLENNGLEYFGKFDIIMRLQATSPLRTAEDIDKGLELFVSKDADSIISVFECPVTPLWMNTLPQDLSMANFIPEPIRRKNRQELPTHYQLNGAIFAARWDFIKQKKSWYGEKSYAFIMSKEHSVDVDDMLDLEFARFLISYGSKINKATNRF